MFGSKSNERLSARAKVQLSQILLSAGLELSLRTAPGRRRVLSPPEERPSRSINSDAPKREKRGKSKAPEPEPEPALGSDFCDVLAESESYSIEDFRDLIRFDGEGEDDAVLYRTPSASSPIPGPAVVEPAWPDEPASSPIPVVVERDEPCPFWRPFGSSLTGPSPSTETETMPAARCSSPLSPPARPDEPASSPIRVPSVKIALDLSWSSLWDSSSWPIPARLKTEKKAKKKAEKRVKKKAEKRAKKKAEKRAKKKEEKKEEEEEEEKAGPDCWWPSISDSSSSSWPASPVAAPSWSANEKADPRASPRTALPDLPDELLAQGGPVCCSSSSGKSWRWHREEESTGFCVEGFSMDTM